ncbi:MAG TPA: CDGSH iron-sulfur domain-containing protein [Usitatibacteraceae bacterium]
MAGKIDEYRSEKIVIKFEGDKCIHSRNCVLGNPHVFVPNAPGAWIQPDAASVEEVVQLAQACPSGAISYQRNDGGAQEAAPKVNALRIRENGPLAVTAELYIEGEALRFRATLCRCGASSAKPFCDGSHKVVKFIASGEPPTAEIVETLSTRDGPLRVIPKRDGPLYVQGNLEICSGTGRTVQRSVEAWLCRCGQSSNKPFCDGTHRKIGFKAPGA